MEAGEGGHADRDSDGSHPDLPGRGHVPDQHCRQTHGGCGFDYRRLWGGAEADSDRLLCGDGIYAGIPAGGVLLVRRR